MVALSDGGQTLQLSNCGASSFGLLFEREKRNQEAHPFNLALKEMEILTDEQRLGVKNVKTMGLRADVIDHLWEVAHQKAA